MTYDYEPQFIEVNKLKRDFENALPRSDREVFNPSLYYNRVLQIVDEQPRIDPKKTIKVKEKSNDMSYVNNIEMGML